MGGAWRLFALSQQEGHLFPWVPVCLATGIGLYFGLRVEPPVWALAALGLAGAVGLVLARFARGRPRIGLTALTLVTAGTALAGARAHLVAGPVLDFRYYGPMEGRVVGIDRSASDAVRLTLDRVRLDRVAPSETPRRVRVSLHGAQRWLDPAPGQTVILTGHLSGPAGPAEPGGFDFQRHAWFLGLGAVGYTRTPALLLEPPDGALVVFAARRALAARVQDLLPGQTGAVAAAILTGDRSAVARGTQEDLRAANLAHLLAISGLHMGLLAGVVFGGLRFALALWPAAALRAPAKKIAAAIALVAAAGYLVLSGGNVATERAFVMVAVALGAVLCDRRALSLRGVALAALVVLVLRPEALLGPGFQMSFAATTALVAAFGALRDAGLQARWPAWTRGPVSLVVSSAVAGAATAPVAMAHFNMVSHYGLVANLLAVPLMGTVVMPAGVAGLALMPLGLGWIGFGVMGAGLEAILRIAEEVAGLPGAVGHVPAPPATVLPLMAAGGLVCLLWRGAGRLAGLVPVGVAVVLWAGAERPMVLISDTGRLVGVLSDAGRALSRERGEGFVAGIWLENDGAPVPQERAAARWNPSGMPVQTDGGRIFHVRGKRETAAFWGCDQGDIVVTDAPRADWSCAVICGASLRRSGAVALFREESGLRRVGVRDRTGDRLWSAWPQNTAYGAERSRFDADTELCAVREEARLSPGMVREATGR
ncbi:competence protein ComE-like protein [Roseivivax marinus]|uniref:Competence protein ComE-like protein n=1 Tax=Roseivivax marinus TaxID=1379903 RepID=W4HQ06_9RHOB|nr:ComEC/Rec2 family competence protein [Roseivivax marinus]ETW14201.1 competence protein ComE-like protein [Roseivivax marinus]